MKLHNTTHLLHVRVKNAEFEELGQVRLNELYEHTHFVVAVLKDVRASCTAQLSAHR